MTEPIQKKETSTIIRETDESPDKLLTSQEKINPEAERSNEIAEAAINAIAAAETPKDVKMIYDKIATNREVLSKDYGRVERAHTEKLKELSAKLADAAINAIAAAQTPKDVKMIYDNVAQDSDVLSRDYGRVERAYTARLDSLVNN